MTASGVALGLGALFLAFQKKLLPVFVGRWVARIFVFPSLPITMNIRASNYWTSVGDGKVLLGACPLAWFSPVTLTLSLSVVTLTVRCGHVGRLGELGVTGVVNLMDEYEVKGEGEGDEYEMRAGMSVPPSRSTCTKGPVEAYRAAKIQQLRLRVVDHTEPTVEELEKAVQFMQK